MLNPEGGKTLTNIIACAIQCLHRVMRSLGNIKSSQRQIVEVGLELSLYVISRWIVVRVSENLDVGM